MASIAALNNQLKDPHHSTIGPRQVRPLKIKDSTADILAKMYNFMIKNHEDDIRKYELDKDFEEERHEEEQRRHDKLLKAIREGSTGENGGGGHKTIWDYIKKTLSFIYDGVKGILSFIKDSLFVVIKAGLASLSLAFGGLKTMIDGVKSTALNEIDRIVQSLKDKLKFKLPKSVSKILSYVARAVPLLVTTMSRFLPILLALEAAKSIFDMDAFVQEKTFAQNSIEKLKAGGEIGDKDHLMYTIANPLGPHLKSDIQIPLTENKKDELQNLLTRLTGIQTTIADLTGSLAGVKNVQQAASIKKRIDKLLEERKGFQDKIQDIIQNALQYKADKIGLPNERGLNDAERELLDASKLTATSDDIIDAGLRELKPLMGEGAELLGLPKISDLENETWEPDISVLDDVLPKRDSTNNPSLTESAADIVNSLQQSTNQNFVSIPVQMDPEQFSGGMTPNVYESSSIKKINAGDSNKKINSIPQLNQESSFCYALYNNCVP